MALGILLIMYIGLAIIALLTQFLLYKDKDLTSNNIYILNMLFSFVLSFVAFTSLPTNEETLRILAISMAFISALAVFLKVSNKRFAMLSKLMLTFSIIGSFVQLYL